jgi:hypothetical protein
VEVEATRQLADEVKRLSDSREDIITALHGVQVAMEELAKQVAADRAEYDRRLSEASARTEQVSEDSAPRDEVASQVRGTRRRIVIAALLLVAIVGGVASTGLVLVMRARDAAATSAQFDQLARERLTNCQLSQVRTQADVNYHRGELAGDQTALALLTGPDVAESTRVLAHTVFDRRIAVEQAFLATYPAAPLTCTVPTR